MASSRRVGAETSKTRGLLLDMVERLMLEEGYAGVTYRAVAARAGVTAGLVQYYFPTLDDLFVAAIRRRTDRNLDCLVEALRARADEPLRVIWEHSRDEATAALISEFTALGNHRKSIRAEIAKVTEQVRGAQLDALAATPPRRDPTNGLLPMEAVLFLIAGIPKMIKLEKGIGASLSHAEVLESVERFLDAVEPRTAGRDGEDAEAAG
ncbi:TetR/AcrR family transcriptional regulator [Yinghuangia sp. ASG 101]|uniref:TetR/AcrR family transcriptional regulator n=1 Tax=Yinghuangia sp. ASG 101 TaxID=2896848 RepID=UPI001E5DEFE6|nr:TetR/AcrR family transcriptional regulator [Yinghuangia sp. ASG 101]UGQ10980.1 TetR/AcrR family transcriptional regulator [Yinghuangia sp. ASG 101]